MIKMKYLLAGFSCAALLALAPTPQVSAATVKDTGTVSVDVTTQSLVVENNKNQKIYVAFPTVKEKDSKLTISKEGTWSSYTVVDGKVDIDLSSQKLSKDLYVAVKGNVDSDVSIYKLAAQNVKLKATQDKTDSTKITFTNGKSGTVDDSTVQYATTTGDWYPFSKLDTAKYQDGATLRVRVAPVSGSSITALPSEDGKELAVEGYDTYKINDSFASAEAKLKIAKLKAKAKITADYATHTVTVKNATKKEVWVADSTAKTITDGSGNLDAILVSGGAVEAWNDGEKHTVFAFDAKPTLSLSTVELKSEKDSKDKLNLTITNKSKSNDIDVFVDASASKTSLAADTAKKEYKTVKADKSLTIKNVTDKSLIFIRSSANKKTLTWSSDFRIAGAVSGAAIDYSKVSDDPVTPSDDSSSNGNNGGGSQNTPSAADLANEAITTAVGAIESKISQLEKDSEGYVAVDKTIDFSSIVRTNGVSLTVEKSGDVAGNVEYDSETNELKVYSCGNTEKGKSGTFTISVSKTEGETQSISYTFTYNSSDKELVKIEKNS